MKPIDVDALLELVERAGDAIMAIYEHHIEVQTKEDDSPLTKADLASHRLLTEGLRRITPELPVLSEEGAAQSYAERRGWQRYWLIDPLDGTKEFINRNGEFTVNVALIEGNRAVFGIVGVPAQGVVYWGDVKARTAWRRQGETTTRIQSKPFRKGEPLVVVASRSHGGERLEQYLTTLASEYGKVDRTPVGSSLKLCILAEGRADLYPRLGPTSEWDIAAAHAVLEAAGGDLWTVSGDPLSYNAKDSVLNPEFIAVGDGGFGWKKKLPSVPA